MDTTNESEKQVDERTVDAADGGKKEGPVEDESIVGWIAAAAFTGLPISKLRRLASGGRLKTNRDTRGRLLFRRSDLEAIIPVESKVAPLPEPEVASQVVPPATDGGAIPEDRADADGITGTTYSAVFGDLDDGKLVSTIVRERKMSPELVETIAAKWRRTKTIDINAPGIPAEIARMAALIQRAVDSTRGWREWADGIQAWIDVFGANPASRLVEVEGQLAGLPPDCGDRLAALEHEVQDLNCAFRRLLEFLENKVISKAG